MTHWTGWCWLAQGTIEMIVKIFIEEWEWEQAGWRGESLGTNKNFFEFLHNSEHVLILIFESGKKCQKWRLPLKWKNLSLDYTMERFFRKCQDLDSAHTPSLKTQIWVGLNLLSTTRQLFKLNLSQTTVIWRVESVQGWLPRKVLGQPNT